MGGGEPHHSQSPWLEMNYIYLQGVNTCLLSSWPTSLMLSEGDKVWKEIGPAQNHTNMSRDTYTCPSFLWLLDTYISLDIIHRVVEARITALCCSET